MQARGALLLLLLACLLACVWIAAPLHLYLLLRAKQRTRSLLPVRCLTGGGTSVRMDCVDVDTHAWRHTLTHACPLAASSQEDGPVVRRGTLLFGAQSPGPGATRKFGQFWPPPKNSAKPPRARHVSSEDTRAPGRRPAWRRARRGTNATCPSDATWRHVRLDMRRHGREASGGKRETHACRETQTQRKRKRARRKSVRM